MTSRVLGTAALLLFMIQGAEAGQPGACEQESGSALTLLFENDTRAFALFHQSDDEYTNGFRAVWSHTTQPTEEGAFHTVWPFRRDESRCYSNSFGFGQNLYTPTNIFTEQRVLEDRPYAAWLYGTYVVRAFSTEMSPGGQSVRTAQTLEVTAGVVGPAARGEWFQNTSHRVFNVRYPPGGPIKIAKGWANQLRNEPAFLIGYRKDSKRAEAFSGAVRYFDATTHWGGVVGNAFTFARSGGRVRIGYGLRDDIAERPITVLRFIQRLVPDEYYVFGASELRFVLRNEFLDGNLFRSTPQSVQKEAFVVDGEVGAVVRWGPVRGVYRTVIRTPEFRARQNNQYFGSIAVMIGTGL